MKKRNTLSERLKAVVGHPREPVKEKKDKKKANGKQPCDLALSHDEYLYGGKS
jgi:hypothetical protein